MQTTVFESRPLPPGLGMRLRERVVAAHAREPFSTTNPRATIRRVGALLDGLAIRATVYRGGVDLRGAEVDHVWLALETADPLDEPADAIGARAVPATGAGVLVRSDVASGGVRRDAPDAGKLVLDVAFPLLDSTFVAVLRRFVAGDASAEELDAAGAGAGVEARVLGHFPLTVRYLGRPVWSAR